MTNKFAFPLTCCIFSTLCISLCTVHIVVKIMKRDWSKEKFHKLLHKHYSNKYIENIPTVWMMILSERLNIRMPLNICAIWCLKYAHCSW